MDEGYNEVRFDLYCRDCKHFEVPMEEEPCNECIGTGCVKNSIKPIKFEKKEVKDG